jgi:hypothetical protein
MGKYRITVVSVLVFLMAAAFFLLAWHFLSDRLDALEGTAAADATVIATGSTVARRYPVPWAEIRFTLRDGRTITTTLRPAPSTLKGDEPAFRIRYKLHDPRWVVAETNVELYLFIIFLFSLGIIFLVGAYFVSLRDGIVQKGRKSKPQGEQQRGT